MQFPPGCSGRLDLRSPKWRDSTIDGIKASRGGVRAEIIDLRTLVPHNDVAILASVRMTGRVVMDQRTRGFVRK
jgi:pyruvate/2-oxoglutarate/acetoin dehydrogenase E1 component